MTDDITVGMIFEQHGAPHIRWEVDALKQVGDIPHVYLRLIGDPTEVRLLSVSALADEREFRQVGVLPLARRLKHTALCRILGP